MNEIAEIKCIDFKMNLGCSIFTKGKSTLEDLVSEVGVLYWRAKKGVAFTYYPFYREVKEKLGDFRFWIEGDAWRISSCFRSLYIAYILWNYIQDNLV